MVSILTGIATVISGIQFVSLVIRGGKNQNIYQLMLFVVTFVCNVGYFTIGLTDSVEAAIICNNITYFGAVFLPYFILMTISDLCGIKMKRRVIIPVLICSLVVLGLVFSTGYCDIYYSNVYIKKVYGTTHMFKEYGPAHNAYTFLLLGDVILCIGIVIQAYIRKNNFTRKAVFAMLAVLVGPSIVYVVERSVNSPVEFLPFAYIIVQGVYLRMVSNMKMYDMSSSVASAYEKMDEYGYITFDLKKKLMNCNSMARKIFPELKKTDIDSSVKKEDTLFYREIINCLDKIGDAGNNEKRLKVGERSILCTVRKIHSGFRKKHIGYSVELKDNTKQDNYIKLLNNYNEELEAEVKEKTEHILKMQESITKSMAVVVESRDNGTGGHIKRTSECIRAFAGLVEKSDKFNVTNGFIKRVIEAAPMHDLGKIAVDDAILRKPGRFTPEEYEIMKTHSEKGAKIVAQILAEVDDKEFVDIAINVAHYHHEKWDGTGYPLGLRGTDIPLEARIMALADVFDALVSKRCYKEAYDYDRAFKIIEDSLGSHFDPVLGKLFIESRSELESLYDSLPE